MTLSAEDVKHLCKPFQPREHEFNQGWAYITEQAVCERIEEVDPGWGFDILSITRRDEQIIVSARMTVRGVSRDNTGMSKILMSKSGGFEISEAEKSATTDALKRCARLFGVGRYLLNLPKDNERNPIVRDESKLEDWLIANYAKVKPTPASEEIPPETDEEPPILDFTPDHGVSATDPPETASNGHSAWVQNGLLRQRFMGWATDKDEFRLQDREVYEALGVTDLIEYTGSEHQAQAQLIAHFCGYDEKEITTFCNKMRGTDDWRMALRETALGVTGIKTPGNVATAEGFTYSGSGKSQKVVFLPTTDLQLFTRQPLRELSEAFNGDEARKDTWLTLVEELVTTKNVVLVEHQFPAIRIYWDWHTTGKGLTVKQVKRLEWAG